MKKRLQKPLEGKRNNAPLLPIPDLVFLRSSSTPTDPIQLDTGELGALRDAGGVLEESWSACDMVQVLMLGMRV